MMRPHWRQVKTIPVTTPFNLLFATVAARQSVAKAA
ncbi:hypothetical protein Mnod_3209 [Methylobacterium nodulans ORS 2060]|uniref:Uncharacterized protein n=1 Tax=Methylobacterium nodulans (strain LMG 21967 / CNCM I-2342 / ORS 2060) TaxID=460265 RepID=B8IJT7_METNO|nr:hypothetical protein Mnod_3209 [Methylobacterium nodulans ORS 2060]